MFRLFTPLFTEVDRISAAFVNDVSSRVMNAVAPVLALGLTVWFVAWGMLVMRGSVEQPVREFLGRVMRTSLIISVALGTGIYQRDIAGMIREVPDELAAVVAGSEADVRFTADPLEARGRQAALMDRAAGQGLSKAEDAFEKGGLMSQQGVAFYTFGVLLLLATVIMVGVGGALILVAKMMLALLAGLGPLFIAALLFDGTKRFFDRWVAMIATYALIVVLFAAVFTFMLAIFANYMAGVALDGNMNVAYGIGGALVLTIVSLAVLRELHHLAVGLGGGYAHRILLLERPR